MPLAFESLTHGTVAFGFYNIETDALLLDRLFFFCTDFCDAVLALEGTPEEQDATVDMPGYRFDDPRQIGDFHGAMAGARHVGYMGELYLRWPFPTEPARFRQRVYGEQNRAEAEAILKKWGVPTAVPVTRREAGRRYDVGPYGFSAPGYLQLLQYVWRGGYPTWEGFEEGRRPDCVAEMARRVVRLQPLLNRDN